MTVATFTAVVNELLPEPAAGLLNGMLFGTRASLTPELYRALVTTGTLHIIALSGMNITILTNLVNLVLLKLISRRPASLLTILLIGGFVWFVGASPSVVRAAIMGGISLLAVIFGRQTWAILSWLLAIGIMLLLNFSWLGELSFQLSALATLGIILFSGKQGEGAALVGAPFAAHPSNRLEASAGDAGRGTPKKGSPLVGILGGKPAAGPAESKLRMTVLENVRLPAALWPLWSLMLDDLRLTLAAQVFTIPLILWAFHRVSLVSPLANLLIGWVIAPVTALGILTVAVGSVFLPAGQVLAWIVWIPLTYLVKIVEIVSTLPFASLGW